MFILTLYKKKKTKFQLKISGDRIRGNILKLFTISDCQANSPLLRKVMDYSWRRTLELDNGYFVKIVHRTGSHIIKNIGLFVYVMQVQVPVQLVRKDVIQTFSMVDSNFYGKPKSKATRMRDKIRKQSLLENKRFVLHFRSTGLKLKYFGVKWRSKRMEKKFLSSSQLQKQCKNFKLLMKN